MTEIEWAEPPSHGNKGRSSRWNDVADALRGNPGRWAKVKDGTTYGALVTRIRRGDIAAFRPAGTFETRSVTVGGGKFDIYARFVGGESA